MEGYAVDTILPATTWVRALYDYESEDQTSLSFRAGDIIQVLTQLDSGWWDGIIQGQRGWFPSNYCEEVQKEESRSLDQALHAGTLDAREAEVRDGVSQSRPFSNGWQYDGRVQEQAAFWIPQCTEDGTLFYFNTLTGETKMTLPLESPVIGAGGEAENNDNADLRHSQSAGTDGQDDDAEHSSSETDLYADSKSSPRRKSHSSYISDGASPATSIESLELPNATPPNQSRRGFTRPASTSSKSKSKRQPARDSKMQPSSARTSSAIPARFLDYNNAVPLTWDRLLEDIEASIERFKRAIENHERSQYVRRAEDISDHVRLVLAAGSGTTDNHSGNPSIITANRLLYPRFRDMMSAFARLVLDSHICAADYAPQDYGSKCLNDADGVMEGVYGYIEVARQQRGEEIPRLFPGFIGDSHSGGNWQNNGLSLTRSDPTDRRPRGEDHSSRPEPSKRLDAHEVAQMDGLRREIVLGLKRLEEKLAVKEKLITYPKHRRLTRDICNACQAVLELYRPWMSHLESITLAPLGDRFQTPQIAEFNETKQLVYNIIAELVMSCQAVGLPLADEWAQDRGLPLEDRLLRVKAVSMDLETATSRVNATLQTLQGIMPAAIARKGHAQQPSTSGSLGGRSMFGSVSSASSPISKNLDAAFQANAGSKKLQKLLGHVPTQSSPTRDSMASLEQQKEPVPHYLQLDYDGELQFTTKTQPPTVQAGTITALIEQLTRHDHVQSSFEQTFLHTYQSFMNGQELFEQLVQRWSIQPPPGLTEHEYDLWEKGKQAPIRFRVYNVIRHWVESYWMEENDINEQNLLQRLHSFVDETVADAYFQSTRPLLNIIEARMRGEEPQTRKTIASYQEGPAPKLPKNMKKFKFQDIDPTEFARQLTIIQQRLYCQIKPSECLARTWGSKITPVKEVDEQKGIRENIRHANQVTNYMAELILTQADLKKRATMLKTVIQIADACYHISNFGTLTAVLSSLGMSAVARLGRTHNMLDRKSKDKLEFLRSLMATEKNYGQYREALRNASLPSLPFLGITLQDMRFVDDAMPSLNPSSGLINFAKRTAMADQVRLLMSFQNIPYSFKSSAELQSYINDKVQQAGNVDLFELSLKCEPREREDEKIARLLSESGFL